MMGRRRIVALAPLLASSGYDVIHVHTPFVAHYAGVALGRRLGLPVVESYHTFFEEYLHYYVPFLPRALMRLLARRMSVTQCNAIDALVVPSARMLERLRSYGVTARAEVLPTGLDLSRFRGGDGPAFRALHGIEPKRPLLQHISRVAHEKNIDFVLEALALVRASVPDLLLVVGYLDRGTTLPDCHRAGDAFVFASRTETQGLVLLEALALGVPVVSTAVMGTAQVLDGARGAIVAPDEITGFGAAVTRVLQNPRLRAELAAAGPADAASWSAAAMAERLTALYRELVGGTRRPRYSAVPPVVSTDPSCRPSGSE